MRINRIVEKTFAEGPGCRFCIWVQGCSHYCEGCFATDLWDYQGGFDISVKSVQQRIDSVKDEICGITFLGGEPFDYAKELSEIAHYIHSLDKSVITFTGYQYEELREVNDSSLLLEETDLLIDGRFEKELMDFSRPLIGSSNQRFLFLTERIAKDEIDNYKNRFEVRISEQGITEINGMGNIKKLQLFLKDKREC